MKTDRGLQKCIKSGTLLYPNGVVFEGEFDKDYVQPQGNGKLKLYKGSIFEGEFHEHDYVYERGPNGYIHIQRFRFIDYGVEVGE